LFFFFTASRCDAPQDRCDVALSRSVQPAPKNPVSFLDDVPPVVDAVSRSDYD